MLKNVAGIWFESKPAEDEWVVRTYQLGNGHKEAVISRPTVWQEVPPHLQQLFGDDWQQMADRDREEKADERREANRQRAARRAKRSSSSLRSSPHACTRTQTCLRTCHSHIRSSAA